MCEDGGGESCRAVCWNFKSAVEFEEAWEERKNECEGYLLRVRIVSEMEGGELTRSRRREMKTTFRTRLRNAGSTSSAIVSFVIQKINSQC
jgi:hypothetical protein